MLRRQLPVHSPITLRAVMSGVGAGLYRDHAALTSGLIELLRDRYHASDVILTDSGTSALRLAMEGAAVDSDRSIAIPAYACYDIATASEGAGRPVVLYDVDAATLGPDPESLAELRPMGPGAIVVAHLFGHLVDPGVVDEVLSDVLIIEDAAQGAGGELNGRPLGSFGSLSVLSFGRGKGVTGGGGGALLAHDERGVAALERVRREHRLVEGGRGMAQLGALVAQALFGRPAVFGLPAALPFLHIGETRYEPPRPPRGLSPVSMAVLGRVLPRADREIPIRRRNASRLLEVVARCDGLRAAEAVRCGSPGYLRLPLVLTGRDDPRTDFLTAEAKRLGIAGGYPATLSELPSLTPFIVGPERQRPGAELLARSLITLPTHSLLRERDLRSLEGWLLRFRGARGRL